MTPDILRLVRVGFDSLENHSPRYEETVGLFIGTPEHTAQERVEEWLAAHVEESYRGYDGQTYPYWHEIRDPIL